MRVRRLASLRRLLAIALLVLIVPQADAKTLPVPALTGRVVDQANILSSSEESHLTTKLGDLETRTSIQLVVVTLPSLEGAPIEDWGLTLGRSWGIGPKGKNNGVLLIVAPNDRELRIEVGYGLEGTLPDATADSIIRNVILPRFKAGDMGGGISDGVDAIIAVLTGTGEDFTPSRRERVGQALSQWAAPVLFIGFFILMVILARFGQGRGRGARYYRRTNGGWLYTDGNDRWGGGGFGGGRSGGGGFSGGGGSFGGGGASGRW